MTKSLYEIQTIMETVWNQATERQDGCLPMREERYLVAMLCKLSDALLEIEAAHIGNCPAAQDEEAFVRGQVYRLRCLARDALRWRPTEDELIKGVPIDDL